MKFYFDKLVYLTFANTFIVFLAVMLFKQCNKKDLVLAYSIPETGFRNEIIQFTGSTAGAETWEWDFGDRKGKSFEQKPEHIFENAGTYIVSLTVNNNFKAQKKIEIKQTVFTEETEAPIIQTKSEPDKLKPSIQKEKKIEPNVRVSDSYFVKANQSNSDAGKPATYETQAGINLDKPYSLCPIQVKGDKEFTGITVTGHVALRISGDRKIVYAAVYAWFEETAEDGTKAIIDGDSRSGQVILYKAPTGKKIIKVNAEKEYFEFYPPAETYNLETKNCKTFVHRIEVVADTKGRDLPCDYSTDKSLFTIYFNDFRVLLTND